MMKLNGKTEYVLNWIDEYGHSKAIWVFRERFQQADSETERMEAYAWMKFCVNRLVLATGNERYYLELGL